jgi:hypothetical protein
MKPFFFLLYAAAVLVACDNGTKAKTEQAPAVMNSDLLQQNLKGKVKSITETSSTIDSTGNEKQDSLTTYTSFDEKGYQTVSMTKNSAGKVTTEQFASRNDSGIVTEFGTKKNGHIFSRVVTEFDKDGKYIGGKSYDSTGKQDGYYKDLAQNEYSIVYAGKRYGLNNKLKETFDMKYDKNHFLGGKSTDSTGKVTYEGTAKVNDKGDMSEEDYTYVENGKSKSEKKTYKYDNYDNKGNWTQRTTYNDKGKRTQVVKRSFTYYD